MIQVIINKIHNQLHLFKSLYILKDISKFMMYFVIVAESFVLSYS